MAANTNIDDRTPMTFELPDGDLVTIPTWAFIIDRLGSDLRPTIDQLLLINTALQAIDTKLDDWIPD